MFVLKQIPQELDAFEGDLVIAVVGQDERPLRATNSWLDWRLYGTLSDLIFKGYYSAKLGERCLIPTYGKFRFDRLVMVGGGLLFDHDLLPNEEEGMIRWSAIADEVRGIIQSLKVEKVGLSLPRFEIADHERALLKTFQMSHLPSNLSLFMSRATNYIAPLSL